VWAAVFHSVSAFCNAGFSVFRNGLMPLASSWGVCITVMLLIVVGGLGFPVAAELLRRLVDLVRRRRSPRLSLHARVVLVTTALLVVGGAIGFLLLEHGGSMGHLSWSDRVVAAFFQSVTTRTAGFNTVDFGLMQPATLFFACFLMFIGASPGSTGGGVKTTTLATLVATLRAELTRAPGPELSGRALGTGTVRKAVAVTIMSVAIVSVLLFVLLLTEEHTPAQLVFEVVSAFSTTGLSTGITPKLGSLGEAAIILGMFVGRIGPLTLALAVATAARDRRYRLAEEQISIG
jgi:trk system potassium uptake protein TrkH